MQNKAELITEQSPWQDLTPGCEIYEPATSKLNKTGEWRSKVPVWDPSKCKQCLLCSPYCPVRTPSGLRKGTKSGWEESHCHAARDARSIRSANGPSYGRYTRLPRARQAQAAAVAQWETGIRYSGSRSSCGLMKGTKRALVSL